MSKPKPLLTLDEAATYLAVSKTTLRRWTNDGRLACHRVGPRNERRFVPDVLDSFVASGVSDTPDLRAPTISGLSGALVRGETNDPYWTPCNYSESWTSDSCE
jgi:excisionase family DNA binding protein